MKTSITIEKDKICVIVTNDFTNESESIVFDKRYAIILRSRWSLLQFFINDYFIHHSPRGSYIGERKDKDGYIYDIWDLSKIFPDVSLTENNFSHLR